MRKFFSGLVLTMGLLGCAPSPMPPPPERVPVPKDAVFFSEDPRHLFDRIVRTLEKEGYETETDRLHLAVQTRPKEINLETEGLHYEGYFVVYVGPDRNGSFAVIRFFAVPEIPDEREKLIKQLQP